MRIIFFFKVYGAAASLKEIEQVHRYLETIANNRAYLNTYTSPTSTRAMVLVIVMHELIYIQ